jgi:hypothetical protein
VFTVWVLLSPSLMPMTKAKFPKLKMIASGELCWWSFALC